MGLGAHLCIQGNSVTSLQTANQTVSSGSAIYIAFIIYGGTVSSVADSQSNTCIQIDTVLSYNTGNFYTYYVASVSSSSTYWVKVTGSTSGLFLLLGVIEITSPTASPLDAHNRQSTSTSPYVSPTVGPTTQASEMLVGFCTDNLASGTDSFAAQNSFTLLDSQTNASVGTTGATAYRIVSSTGSYASSFTSGGGGVSSMGVSIATFKLSGGGSSPALKRNTSLSGLGAAGPFFHDPLTGF